MPVDHDVLHEADLNENDLRYLGCIRAWPCRPAVVSKWTMHSSFGRSWAGITLSGGRGRVELTQIVLGDGPLNRRLTFALAPISTPSAPFAAIVLAQPYTHCCHRCAYQSRGSIKTTFCVIGTLPQTVEPDLFARPRACCRATSQQRVLLTAAP